MTAGRGGAFGWSGIVRVGLVQASIGAMVIVATSTLNRVMVVEASLPAIVPGLLVGLHYAVQAMRPRLGYGADLGRRRTPWILGGLAVLGLGTTVAAVATAMMAERPVAGIALAVAGFLMIGLGVGSAGTSLLVLLASSVDERRRAAAATIVWIMMIGGFVVTAGTAGHLLDPYSPARLVEVTGGVAAIAVLVSALSLFGLERPGGPAPATPGEAVPFLHALAEVWSEPRSRRFALFVFVSMLAYSGQELILEPFAGSVFGLAPGATARLSGVQHAGLLAGMLTVALAGTVFSGGVLGSMRTWTAGGCIASALGVVALAAAAAVGPPWPLSGTVFVAGVANGAFAIAAIAAMMQLVSSGRSAREGVRMGMWGGAQAVAFGLGGFSGAALSDLGRVLTGSSSAAYVAVFLIQAVLFGWAAALSIGVFGAQGSSARRGRASRLDVLGEAGA